MDEIQRIIIERLVVAFVVGIIIGFDRERSGKAAGIRTQMLVCVASTLLSCVSIYLGEMYNASDADPARLMAQIITGIGFLGAGVILKNGSKVSGVTTAATIWITAAIGISIGAGMYIPAFVTTAMVLLLNPIASFQYRYGLKGDYYHLKIDEKSEEKLEKILRELRIDVRMRSVKDGLITATIVSSQQINMDLRRELGRMKMKYDLELADE